MGRWSILLLLFTLGCQTAEQDQSSSEKGTTAERLTVYTVSYPLQYFAERIGGETVEAVFPVPADTDPREWQPGTEVLAAFQEADLILLNGAGYAKWVTNVTLPASRVVDTAKAFEKDLIVIEDAIVHSHGPEGEHSHQETAAITWLDLGLALEQARAVHEALVAARPEERASFDSGFAALEGDLRALDDRLKALVTAEPALPMLGAPPVYQYLARGYRLNLQNVPLQPHREPGHEAWESLEHLLEHHPARWMLSASAPTAELERRLEDQGVVSVVIDPCATRPSDGDFVSVMEANVTVLENILSAS